jgi:biotin carboxyl carrier protein
MKMQNEMKSPKTGKVLEIRTSAGAAVSAGDALLVIE